MKKFALVPLAAIALAALAPAVETRFWQQTDQADFEKGTLTNLSLRSDGRLYLAPEFREVFDPSTPYLWSVVSDGKGNLYTGGGGSGTETSKLFVIGAGGKGHVLAELDGLEIHALALGPDGQIYAATDPDGKIYKVSPQGKSQLFFDPKAKYIWALAFNRQGDLFAATGDQGEIYRITPAGHGSVFFKTGETHARSLALDAQGNLIVGTEPGGLVIRVSPSGSGFVLYQTPKREVTAVALDRTGHIFASAVGTRPSGATSATSSTPPPAAPPGPITISATGAASSNRTPARSPSLPAATTVTGGSEVYEIDSDGSPHKVWTNSQDIVYAIGFDSNDKPLLASGNRGRIYRIDSPVLYTELVDASPTQITSFASAGNRLYVSTGNIGRVYELGSSPAKEGIFESEAFDAGSFTYWGRLALRGTPANVKVSTRSGNLNRPQENWSSWQPLQIEPSGATVPCARCLNGRVVSPAARFLQYKVELSSAAASTPEVASIEIAYLSKNVAPTVEELEVTPANYKFPAPSGTAAPAFGASPTSLSLPALGQHRPPSSVSLDTTTSTSLTYAKGMLGARWSATDENNDQLVYTVEIRATGESNWRLLKDKVHEKYVSWDRTAYPDGEYELRVTASDSPSNPPDQALTGSLVSDPFLIDNTPPQILNLTWAPAGGRIDVRWKARDARSIIDHAEYSVNGGDWLPIDPVSKLSDAPEEEYNIALPRIAPGEQTIAVRVTDTYDNQSVEKIVVK